MLQMDALIYEMVSLNSWQSGASHVDKFGPHLPVFVLRHVGTKKRYHTRGCWG